MHIDWLISKTGMLVAFFILLGVMYGAYDLYDEYAAQREVEAVVLSISNQIAFVANTAPEYSAKKRIDFPDYIHGEPYIFVLDNERHNIRIRLMGKFSQKNITEFAILPQSVIITEGFNSKGEVSAGTTFDDMNMSSAIVVSKNNGYILISAVV